jgi:excisionase family DNA binding protein
MDVNLSNTSTTFNCERLLKPNEVADFLNISRSFAYQLLQTGAIPVVRLGKSVRVRPKDLENFIQANMSPVRNDQ